MAWTEFLTDRRAIDAIYSDPPELSQLYVHEIMLNGAASSLTLRFNLREFPSKPPLKWVTKGFNVVMVSLMFIRVLEIRISGSDLGNTVDEDSLGDLVIVKEGDSLRFHLKTINSSVLG